jgi:hypothetical protein
VASGPLVSDPRLPCFGIDRAHAHRSPDPIVAGLLPVGARPPHPLGCRVASLIAYPPSTPVVPLEKGHHAITVAHFLPLPFLLLERAASTTTTPHRPLSATGAPLPSVYMCLTFPITPSCCRTSSPPSSSLEPPATVDHRC